MNSISPFEFPAPWGSITYLLMATYLFYVTSKTARKGHVDWTFRLGDRLLGPKIGEKRFSYSKSPKVFWLTQALLTYGFSFCLISALVKESDLWIRIASILIVSILFLAYQVKTFRKHRDMELSNHEEKILEPDSAGNER